MPTIRSRRDFARLDERGRTRSDRLMLVRFTPNGLGFDRFAISTSRKVGSAVTRNRIRRRLRELLRASLGADGGWDVLVIVRPAGADATFAELRAALTGLLSMVRATELPGELA